MKKESKKKSTLKQERSFWNNRWKFAKSVFHKADSKPSFSMEEAFSFYSSSFDLQQDSYIDLPSWTKEVMPVSIEKEFDMSAITPQACSQVESWGVLLYQSGTLRYVNGHCG
jgi:hypothetical protein